MSGARKHRSRLFGEQSHFKLCVIQLLRRGFCFPRLSLVHHSCMSGNKDSGKLTSKFCRCIVAWQALASKPVVNMPMHKLRLNKEAMAAQFCSQKIVDLNVHATSNPRAGGSPEPPQAEIVTYCCIVLWVLWVLFREYSFFCPSVAFPTHADMQATLLPAMKAKLALLMEA